MGISSLAACHEIILIVILINCFAVNKLFSFLSLYFKIQEIT